MVSKVLVAVLLVACAAVTAQGAAAQVVGQQPIGITVVEADAILAGWSVKRSILRKPVFNENADKIGTVYDIVVAPDKSISYAIIDAQEFIGIPHHDVAVPVDQLNFVDGKLVLPGATRDALKAMPAFQYARLPAIPKPRDVNQHQ
ncbi:PRC-barrel domain-containing protein [Paraburkholderia sp. FT54]|uniref:PRC-barrel domain-containing protein n=1 Tax=Paraburkholderia sp. FT54 TaxID=3074437 RepID=UPI002877DE46|nr:PRC-barrel domain-containing protein [Paraburkholderia sp. FT54]WNC92263.1 PRC-barrel domain-containing protein [Paraburkholderia sp. FT54]